MKYRKKPVIINAWQWNHDPTIGNARQFCSMHNLPQFTIGSLEGQIGLIIPTLEGDHIATKGDYIIEGIQGEFYPCKPDIFEETYEEV